MPASQDAPAIQDGRGNAPQDFAIVDREVCYDGFFRFEKVRFRHRRYDGGENDILREVFIPGTAVCVLPYDPVRDEVVLIEQFRAGPAVTAHRPWLLEIVGGLNEKHEAPERVAEREVHEETGLAITALERLFDFFASPGYSSEVITLYCGWVDAEQAAGVHGNPGEGEDIRVLRYPADRALPALMAAPVVHAFTVLALQWLALNRAELRARWLLQAEA